MEATGVSVVQSGRGIVPLAPVHRTVSADLYRSRFRRAQVSGPVQLTVLCRLLRGGRALCPRTPKQARVRQQAREYDDWGAREGKPRPVQVH